MKFFYFFTFIIIQSQSQISIPYEQQNKKYTIAFSLGTPPHRQYKIIDQIHPYTLIISELEVSSFLRSKIVLGQDNITYQNQSLSAYLLQDKIAFIKDDDFKHDILGYKFYYTKRKFLIREIEEGLSLSFRHKDTSFSIVHLFYQKKLINQLSYSFEPKGYLGGNIYFGAIPSDILSNYHSYGHCNVEKAYDSWGCNVKKIIIGNDVIQIKGYGIFNGGYPDLSVPSKVFKKFVTIARTYARCTEYIGVYSSYIICQGDIIKNLNITFVFEGFKTHLKLGNFFNCSKICISRIISDKLYKTEFVFGALFLYQYLSIYDYEKQMIFLYSQKNNTFEIDYFSEVQSYSNYIFTITISILVNGIILLLISLFNKKKVQI